MDTAEDIPSIFTEHLELRPMSMAFMRALAAGDLDAASSEIGASLPDDFADDLGHFLEYRLAQLEDDPSIRQWLGRVMVIDEDGAARAVGSIGFHGPPDADGRVEVGYRVDPAHRRRGLASEAVAAMFDWARREHARPPVPRLDRTRQRRIAEADRAIRVPTDGRAVGRRRWRGTRLRDGRSGGGERATA